MGKWVVLGVIFWALVAGGILGWMMINRPGEPETGSAGTEEPKPEPSDKFKDKLTDRCTKELSGHTEALEEEDVHDLCGCMIDSIYETYGDEIADKNPPDLDDPDTEQKVKEMILDCADQAGIDRADLK